MANGPAAQSGAQWKQLVIPLGGAVAIGLIFLMLIASERTRPPPYRRADVPNGATINIVEPPAKLSASESATNMVVTTVDVDTLWKAYDDNEVRADKFYKGTLLEIAGTVGGIDSTLGLVSVTLYGSRRHRVSATMRESAASRVSELNKGDTVRLRCKGDGKGAFGAVYAADCVFTY